MCADNMLGIGALHELATKVCGIHSFSELLIHYQLFPIEKGILDAPFDQKLFKNNLFLLPFIKDTLTIVYNWFIKIIN